MRRFNNTEDQYIKENYLKMSGNAIAKALNRNSTSIYQRYSFLGLKVPQELREHLRFKKGLAPANKGKKWSEWMSPEGIKKSKKTLFKRGHVPNRKRKVLEIVKWNNINGRTPILAIYKSEGKPIPLHRYIWEQSNGPIKKEYNITFKDGNSLNCNLDNLEIISNADLLRRNSAHNYPPEIFKIIQLRGALNRQINKRLKQLSNEK